MIAGPIYAKLIAPHMQLADDNPMADQFTIRTWATLPGADCRVHGLFPVLLMWSAVGRMQCQRPGSR